MPSYKNIALAALLSLSKVEAYPLRGGVINDNFDATSTRIQELMERIQTRLSEDPVPVAHGGGPFDEEAYKPTKDEIVKSIEKMIVSVATMDATALEKLKLEVEDHVDALETDMEGSYGFTEEEIAEVNAEVVKLEDKIDEKDKSLHEESASQFEELDPVANGGDPFDEKAAKPTKDEILKTIEKMIVSVATMDETALEELKLDVEDHVNTLMREMEGYGFTEEEIDDVYAEVVKLEDKIDEKDKSLHEESASQFEEREEEEPVATKDDIVYTVHNLINAVDTMTESQLEELELKMESSNVEEIAIKLEGLGFAEEDITEISAGIEVLGGKISERKAFLNVEERETEDILESLKEMLNN